MDNFFYTACYCEENIWHLCGEPKLRDAEKYVVWIGGQQSYHPFWYQRVSVDPEMPVWWDYHVVLLVWSQGWKVWDLDTSLSLPVDAGVYFSQTFRLADELVFRVMDSEYYRQVFSSDRSHMMNAGRQWLSAPPEWPFIQNGRLTFAEMRDFADCSHGELLNIEGLRKRFT